MLSHYVQEKAASLFDTASPCMVKLGLPMVTPLSSASPRWLSRLLAAMMVFDAAFLAFVGVAAWSNRLAVDDFGYLATRNQWGIMGGAQWYWLHWTGRFATSLLIGGTSGVAAQNSGRLAFYTLATFALMIGALSFFLARIGQRFQMPLTPLRALTAGTFACALLVLGTRNMGEVWFWLAGSATYVWPLALLFFALGLLAPFPATPRPPAVAFTSLLLVLLPFLNDSLVVIILPFFAVALLQQMRAFPPTVPLKSRIITLSPFLLPLVCCIAAWIFCALAPGPKVRIAATGGLHWAVAFKMTLLSLVRGGGYLLLKQGHAFLLTFLIGAAVGIARRNQPSFVPLSQPVVRRRVGQWVAFVGTVSLLTLFPSVLAYGFAVDRVYIHLTVALVAASFCGGVMVGQQNNSRLLSSLPMEKRFPLVVLGGAVLLFGYAVFSGRTMLAYARAYDARYAFLQSLRTDAPPTDAPSGTPVSLEALPSSGPLHNAEILHNPNHWINLGLQEALHLPRRVRLEGEGIDPVR